MKKFLKVLWGIISTFNTMIGILFCIGMLNIYIEGEEAIARSSDGVRIMYNFLHGK